MSTRRQRRAAQRNAEKSQGPVTPEGNARSAANATRHGLVAPGRLADSICLTIESREEFLALHQTYIDTHAPANPGEHHIVEEMAVARWHLQRAWVMHTAVSKSQAPAAYSAMEKGVLNARNRVAKIAGAIPPPTIPARV